MEKKQPNDILRRERELRGWSQQTLAEKLGTNEQAVNRWENGLHRPNRHFQAQLCQLFGKNAEELGLMKHEYTSTREKEITASENRPLNTIEEYLPSLAELFTGDNTRFSNSRRLLLQNLLTSAIITTNLWNLPTNNLIDLFLQVEDCSLFDSEEDFGRLENVIASAWQLLKSDGIATVEYILASFLPYTESFIQHLTKNQERAAAIMSQGYILAGLVAVLNMQLRESIRCCRKAIFYAKVAKNHNLEVAALKHLATKFTDSSQPLLALQTYQEAMNFAGEVSQLLQSRSHLGLALAYAQLKQKSDALYHLNLAQEIFPQEAENDPAFCYADCGVSSLYHYGGLIAMEFDEFEKAQHTFQRVREHPSRTMFPERTRLEIINCQAQASLALGDIHVACELVELGVKGAKRLHSEKRYNDTLAIYKQMRLTWSQEQQVKGLADLFNC